MPGRPPPRRADCCVRLWDLATRTCAATLRGHTSPILALAHLGGGRLVSGDERGCLRVWDAAATTRSNFNAATAHNICLWVYGGWRHQMATLLVNPAFGLNQLPVRALCAGRRPSPNATAGPRPWTAGANCDRIA